MNRVLLTGRLTRDPEMRGLASGKNVTTFTVASNEFIGGGKEKAEYHAVVTWDRLAEIAEAAGRVVERQQLFGSVWGPSFYGDERALDVYIRMIRKKIEPDASRPIYLHTVRGVGYRLAEEPVPRCADSFP